MITAHLATIPDREGMLKTVIESLVPHTDHVFVALNSYSHVPTWFSDFPTITYRVYDNHLGDAHKFEFINEVGGRVLVTDDDLTWNTDAINLLSQKVSKYGCPCSYHGKSYTTPFKGFKYFSGNYRCLGTTVGDHQCQVIGTGTLMFDTSMVKLSMNDFPYKNMADVLFSCACLSQGVKMMAVEHRAGIVGYLNPKTTIWGNTKDYSIHNRIIKEFLK